MFKTYFDGTQIALIGVGGVCFVLSLFFHLKDRERLQISFLLLTAFFIYCFAALLYPFLNVWDERFHALVAKNLVHHPLMPTLYDNPVVEMAYDRWDRYYIWLHKPPLFLWEIALSFRLFGVSEFTLRLPNVILAVALVYAGYRCGKLLVNKRTGYITGVLMVSCLYFLELAAGRQMSDHNDFSFLTYVSLSIWAWIEYCYLGKKYWIFVTGIFAGFAILCKWLVGLLVYAGWGVYVLLEKQKGLKQYLPLTMAVATAVMIAAP